MDRVTPTTNYSLSFSNTHTQRLRADLEDREAQLRAKEEEMKQRDAEISRLMAELRICQAQLPRHQV